MATSVVQVKEEAEEKKQAKRHCIRLDLSHEEEEDPSDEEDEDSDEYELIPPRRCMTDDEIREYRRQISVSRGFDVQSFEGVLPGSVVPYEITETNAQRLIDLAKQALQVYNDQNKVSFEYERLIKANHQCVAGIMYYITFDALSGSTRGTFRARVWKKVMNQGSEVRFCEMI